MASDIGEALAGEALAGEALFNWAAFARELCAMLQDAQAERDRLQVEVDAHNDASTPAFDEIAAMCGCPQWEYPGQVIRDVKMVVEERDALRTECEQLRPVAKAHRDRLEALAAIPSWFEGAMLAAAVGDAKAAVERSPIDLDAYRARADKLVPSELVNILDELQLYRNLARQLMALAKYEQAK